MRLSGKFLGYAVVAAVSCACVIVLLVEVFPFGSGSTHKLAGVDSEHRERLATWFKWHSVKYADPWRPADYPCSLDDVFLLDLEKETIEHPFPWWRPEYAHRGDEAFLLHLEVLREYCRGEQWTGGAPHGWVWRLLEDMEEITAHIPTAVDGEARFYLAHWEAWWESHNSETYTAWMMRALTCGSPDEKMTAAENLALMGDYRFVPAIVPLLREDNRTRTDYVTVPQRTIDLLRTTICGPGYENTTKYFSHAWDDPRYVLYFDGSLLKPDQWPEAIRLWEDAAVRWLAKDPLSREREAGGSE